MASGEYRAYDEPFRPYGFIFYKQSKAKLFCNHMKLNSVLRITLLGRVVNTFGLAALCKRVPPILGE